MVSPQVKTYSLGSVGADHVQQCGPLLGEEGGPDAMTSSQLIANSWNSLEPDLSLEINTLLSAQNAPDTTTSSQLIASACDSSESDRSLNDSTLESQNGDSDAMSSSQLTASSCDSSESDRSLNGSTLESQEDDSDTMSFSQLTADSCDCLETDQFPKSSTLLSEEGGPATVTSSQVMTHSCDSPANDQLLKCSTTPVQQCGIDTMPPSQVMADTSDSPETDQFMQHRALLSHQGGVTVLRQGDFVVKSGDRVKPNEEAALRLVQRSTTVPVPNVYESFYAHEQGRIRMDWVDGEPLDNIWEYLDDDTIKERICRQTWEFIDNLRKIPKPDEFKEYFQCGADGTTSEDVLIEPLSEHDPTPLLSDQDLRQRIYERYLHFHGERFEHELPSMLPQSEKCVFTHGDIAPRNIIVHDDYESPIASIIDWESAGWYPEYWEYSNMMRPSSDKDWRMWMEKTAPQTWDVSGITAARRVLF